MEQFLVPTVGSPTIPSKKQRYKGNKRETPSNIAILDACGAYSSGCSHSISHKLGIAHYVGSPVNAPLAVQHGAAMFVLLLSAL